MTKSLSAILLAATALTGCAHLPSTPAQIVETKVNRDPEPPVLPATPQAGKPTRDPNFVSHDGAGWSFPAAPAPAAKATWQAIPHGAPIVSKVKLTLTDGTASMAEPSVPLTNPVMVAFKLQRPVDVM